MSGRTAVSLLAKFWGLPTRDRVATLRAGLLALIVEVGVRVIPVARLAKVMNVTLAFGDGSTQPDRATPPASTPERLTRLRAVDRVYRHWPWGDTCLRRALVAARLLAADGAVVRLGVARRDHDFDAHAWIEVGGLRYGASEDYRPLRRSRMTA